MSEANPKTMTIRRPGNAARAPEGIFNAHFWVEMLLDSQIDGENTAGVGRAQREGEPVEKVRTRDAIWFVPDELHWHGATADSPFGYLSIQGFEKGRFVDWRNVGEPQR